MAKIPKRIRTYWQKIWRSPQDDMPTVIDVKAERMEADPEPLSTREKLLANFLNRFKKVEPVSDFAETALEEEIEETLEEKNQGKIAQVFQRYLRRVKPEDIEKIKARLGEMRRGPVKEVWGKVQSLVKMMKDPEAAWKSKAVAIAALVYLISPFDAVPDVIPFVGLLDDVALIAAVVSTLATELEKYVTRQAEKQAEIEVKKHTQKVRITLLGSIAAAAIAIIVKLILNTLS